MKKFFCAILFAQLCLPLLAQLSDVDTLLMTKAINNFRKDLCKPYLLVDKTFLDDYREFRHLSGAATNQIDALKTKLSEKTKSELKTASTHFSQVDIPMFYRAIPVKIWSPVLDFFLDSKIVMNETETKNKKPELFYSEQIKYYKEAYELDDLQAFHLSEPYYDSTKNYSAIIVTIFRPKISNTYLVLLKQKNAKWQIMETQLAKTYSFDY